MPIRVAISEFGGFDFSDEAILLCVDRGMTLAPSLADPDDRSAPGFDFFAWDEEYAQIDGRKYGVYGEHTNAFRTHPIVLEVLEELGERAMAPTLIGRRSRFKIVEIPFDSTEGWHIRDQECATGEFICEDHRTWS